MRRGYDERGIALPSPVAMLSLAAVVVAGVAFVTTSGDQDPVVDRARPVLSGRTAAPERTPKQPAVEEKAAKKRTKDKAANQADKGKADKADKADKAEAKKDKSKAPRQQPVRRSDIYVEVYNNSGITGLAGATADSIAGAGWQVVGSDNWYGTIPASTVYYPERLQRPAELLAKELGIGRIMPAISPMRFDRLTVILTTDYS